MAVAGISVGSNMFDIQRQIYKIDETSTVHRVQSPFLCFHLKMPAAITLDAPTAAELRPKESDGGEEEEVCRRCFQLCSRSGAAGRGVAVAMSAHHHQGDEGGQENGGQHPDGHDHHRLHGDCGSHSGGGGGGQAATRQEQKEQEEEEEEESNHEKSDDIITIIIIHHTSRISIFCCNTENLYSFREKTVSSD
ncbi:hypothetical protein INR49_003993, partial [Caranx melampygus]